MSIQRPVLNLVLLNSLPLPEVMRVETGAVFASEIMVGIDPMFYRVTRNVRETLDNAYDLNVLLLLPMGVPLNRKSEEAVLELIEDPSIRIESVVRKEESHSWLDTFEAAASALVNLPTGPVVLLVGDVLIDRNPLLLEANFTETFKVCALDVTNSEDLLVKDQLVLSERWTPLFEGEGGTFLVEPPSMGHKPDYVYSGCCSFKDVTVLQEFVADFIGTSSADCSSTHFFKRLFNFKPEAVVPITGGFHDFGSVDTFWQSRFKHLSSRSFNKLELDLDKGVIRKTSRSPLFEGQASWYTKAVEAQARSETPASIKKFLPSSSLTLNPSSNIHPEYTLELELLGSPSLADLLNRHPSADTWLTAARRVSDLLTALHGIRYACGSNVFQESCYYMYITKTNSRLREFFDQRPDLLSLQKDRIEILDGESHLIQDIRLIKEHHLTFSKLRSRVNYEPTLLHGDLCFSNILFDTKTTVLKVIDPRGEFLIPKLLNPVQSAYGDPAYDLAKLLHSCEGFYDLILNRSAKYIRKEDGVWSFQVFEPGILNNLKLFKETILTTVNRFEHGASLIRRAYAIQPLLFLSMLPLHYDNPERQKQLLLRGLHLLFNYRYDKTQNGMFNK
jgi:Phosphotransferase enzyme family